MQAGLITGLRKIELREFPEPEPGDNQAAVRIDFCGICGTDVHGYLSDAPVNPSICGHEWSGTVSGVRGVAHLREGDRVAIGVGPACGQCASCRRGDAAHCDTVLIQMIGVGPYQTPHGGFAPSIAVSGDRLYKVRDSISHADAAQLEPATIALHAVRRTPIRLGDAVVVVGAGPIGLLVQQCARAAGAGVIAVVEPNKTRAALARQLGADAVLDPAAVDLAEQLAKALGTKGADVVFECAGIPSTIQQSAELARRGGTIALVGLANVPAEIVPATWLMKESRLIPSLGYTSEEFDIAMGLIQDGRLQVAPLHTDTVGLSELAGAFERLTAVDRDVKILVDPNT